jgi:hypothetical protein
MCKLNWQNYPSDYAQEGHLHVDIILNIPFILSSTGLTNSSCLQDWGFGLLGKKKMAVNCSGACIYVSWDATGIPVTY